MVSERQGWRELRLPAGPLKLLLAGWAVSELIALIVVVKVAGIGGAILLSIASSLLGLVMLRRLGLGAARHLRSAIAGGAPPEGVLLDGMLAALGAILLILPGFASDLAGLALTNTAVRQGLATRFGGALPRASRRATPAPAGVIDLAPGEWTVVDRPGPR